MIDLGDEPGGIAERVVGPLARASLENALQRGQAALTGPVARGDAGRARGRRCSRAHQVGRDNTQAGEWRQCRAVVWLGASDPAEEAVVAGYLDEVVPADAVLDRAKAEATRLGALSRTAYKGTKDRLRGRTIAHILATLDEDVRSLAMPAG